MTWRPLETFERAALATDWDLSRGAYHLGHCRLLGPARLVKGLSREEASDYQAVKKAVLCRFEIAEEFYHQQCQARKKAEECWPRLLAQTLRNALEWWIQPAGKTVAEVLDLFTLEQFLEDLDEETKC